MKKIDKDVNNILSLDDKRQLLRELGQEDLLDVFKQGYKPKYTPAVQKKSPLDQQLAFSASKEEKNALSKELLEIRKIGPGISISAFVRNQVTSEIDMKDWAEKAYAELKKINSPEYSKEEINKRKTQLMLEMEESEDKDTLETQLELNKILEKEKRLKRQRFKRKYRLSTRVTFKEAQTIRWRAARLNLTIADYLRYLMFSYYPGHESDLGLSLKDRKRFYISVLDVYKNGWNEPDRDNESCPNCKRYLDEIRKLKDQIERYRTYVQED